MFKPIRHRYKKRGLSTTKPGSIIKELIPIRTNQWDETRPGYLEADTVAHCGNSIAGMFVYSINMVDIATGWSKNVEDAVNKGLTLEQTKQSVAMKEYDKGYILFNWLHFNFNLPNAKQH